MFDSNEPKFDDYRIRPKRGDGPTQEEENQDQMRHAWVAYLILGLGVALLVSWGMFIGVLKGEGPIWGIVGLALGCVWMIL